MAKNKNNAPAKPALAPADALYQAVSLCRKAGGIRAEVSTAAGLFAHRVNADLSARGAHHPHQLLFGAAGHAANALAGRDLFLCHPISLLWQWVRWNHSAVSSVLGCSALGSSSSP